MEHRIARARLPERWTLDTYPWALQPGVRRARLLQLASLDFIARAENLVLIGPTGVGKTGLASALLLRALQAGYRGLFIKAQELFDEMYQSLADRSTRRLLDRLSRMELLLIDLATCHFIERHENVLVVGPTGVGKSHIAQALGHRACRKGHSVYFVSAHDLLGQLRMTRADNTFERRLLRFTTPDLLIVDDLGLRPLQGDEPLDLYEVVRQRYERGSIIISSNRAIDEWGALFKDNLLASAAVDRLLHHAHVVVMEGDTYRNPPASRRSQAGVSGKPVSA